MRLKLKITVNAYDSLICDTKCANYFNIFPRCIFAPDQKVENFGRNVMNGEIPTENVL